VLTTFSRAKAKTFTDRGITVPLSQEAVTELLLAWNDGDEQALEKLTSIVYKELHRLARFHMSKENPGHTLQATALVNEAYLRLIKVNNARWQDRAHFFAVASKLMRHILVDFARSHRYLKRGGGNRPVSFDEGAQISDNREQNVNLELLDEALSRLEAIDPRKSQVVEHRFFGGLSVQETAEVLKVSQSTVLNDWRLAKVWLMREMSGDNPDGS
jgi:RNA polymerase sigma factor (TIGR02999 family)